MPKETSTRNGLAQLVAQRIGDLTGEALMPFLPVDGHPRDAEGRNWNTVEQARSPAERQVIDTVRDEYDLEQSDAR